MNLEAPLRPPLGVWPAVWKLLRLRITIFVSGFRRAKPLRKIGLILLGLLTLAFLGFIFFLSWLLLRFLNSPDLVRIIGDPAPLFAAVPVLITAGAFIGVLLTSFGVLLQALYLAGDMEFLLTAPLPIHAVFLAKLLQAILPNFALICLFSLPVLYGLGASAGYNVLYYPLVLVVLVALALAAAGLSALLVLGVVRVFPARRVAEVLGFLGAILSFICSQSGNLARFNEFDPDQAAQMFQTVNRLNVGWSPLAWPGRALTGLATGEWGAGFVYLALTLGVSALVFVGTLNVAERLYYSGWAGMQAKTARKKTPARREKPARPNVLVSLAERLVPTTLRAIIVKDWYTLRRDLRNMSQLVTPLIFGIVYAFLFLRGGGEADFTSARSDAPEFLALALGNFALYANVGLSLFVGWMLIARLAGMGFSQEGRSYWVLKSAPVSTSQLLAAKFLVAYIPSLVLGWGFLLVISLIQRASIATLAFTFPVVALCIAGNAGINLAFGVVGARFDWEDPRQMMKGGAGCLSALVGMGYLVVSLGLFFIPPLVLAVFGLPDLLGQAAGLLLGGAACLAAALGPLWLVHGRVKRLGEN